MKKLNLIPVYQLIGSLQDDSGHQATFNAKFGTLKFSKDYVRDRNLDGQFLKVFVDGPSKVIAWQKIEGSDLLKNKKLRKVKSGGITVPKDAVATFLKLDKKRSYRKMPVRQYKDGVLIGTVDYIELK